MVTVHDHGGASHHGGASQVSLFLPGRTSRAAQMRTVFMVTALNHGLLTGLMPLVPPFPMSPGLLMSPGLMPGARIKAITGAGIPAPGIPVSTCALPCKTGRTILRPWPTAFLPSTRINS